MQGRECTDIITQGPGRAEMGNDAKEVSDKLLGSSELWEYIGS